MASVTVRIEEKSHKALRELAERSGESMQTLLTQAIEAYRRERFLHSANAAYETLRKDPKTWRREQQERAAWDATLRDTPENE